MQIAKAVHEKEQMNLIIECRKSGLTDKEWCEQNGIKVGTFYNWVKRFKQNGHFEIPEREKVQIPIPKVQDVVKVDILPDFTKGPISPNAGAYASCNNDNCMVPTVEIAFGSSKIRLANDVDPNLLSMVIHSIGGLL